MAGLIFWKFGPSEREEPDRCEARAIGHDTETAEV